MRYLLILNIIWLGLIFGEAHAESSYPVFVNMEVIKQIESSNNPLAYNTHSQARGWFQITPICLKDFNIVNKTHYKAVELFDPQINSKIAYWYMNERIPQLLRASKLPDNVDNRLRAYNAGLESIIQNEWPLETVRYIQKYHKLEKETK